MNTVRLIAFSLSLSLLVPCLSLAAPPDKADLAQSSPWFISQNLPPIQGAGYNNGYSAPYNSQQYSSMPAYAQQQPLQGYVMTAPAGTVVPATLGTAVSSEFARVGDHFTAMLGSPLVAGNSVILPSGSQMDGQIVMVKAAGHTGKNGELEIRFTSATLPNGQRMPLSARIQTEDGTGIIKGGNNVGRLGRAAVTTGVGAGLGAALGTAMGPLADGRVGRGAIYGTILGAGMGALGSAWQKGKPATIPSGTPVNVVLDQPLTTSPTGASTSNYSPTTDQNYQPYPSGGAQQPNAQPYNNYYGGQ